MSKARRNAGYIDHLPAVFQAETTDTAPAFLERFLYGFEKVLSGIPDDTGGPEGINEQLDRVHDYFDPYRTPTEFLPWLAGWVGVVLKEGGEWDEERKRRLIAQVVPLYKKRGTREGLEEYLKVYVGEKIKISINEFTDPFRVGFRSGSTVGSSTIVGEGRPYYFNVHMVLPAPNRTMLEKKKRAIVEIIDQEKPAHTYFTLTTEMPTMRIGTQSTVGSDTLLGGENIAG